MMRSEVGEVDVATVKERYGDADHCDLRNILDTYSILGYDIELSNGGHFWWPMGEYPKMLGRSWWTRRGNSKGSYASGLSKAVLWRVEDIYL